MLLGDDVGYRDIGMRTLVDLPKLDLMALDALGRKKSASRAQIIREAITEYLERQTTTSRVQAFGLWT